jgi:hypothetical protein
MRKLIEKLDKIEKVNKEAVIRAYNIKQILSIDLFYIFDKENLKDEIENRYLENSLDFLIYNFLYESLENLDEDNDFIDEFLYNFNEFKEFITNKENINLFFNRVEDFLKLKKKQEEDFLKLKKKQQIEK